MFRNANIPIQAMKAHRGVEIWLHLFLISALDRWKTSSPSRLGPGKFPSYATNSRIVDFLSKSGSSRKLYPEGLRQPLFETSSAPYPDVVSRDRKTNAISTQLNPQFAVYTDILSTNKMREIPNLMGISKTHSYAKLLRGMWGDVHGFESAQIFCKIWHHNCGPKLFNNYT